jgi:hypothetical protein
MQILELAKALAEFATLLLCVGFMFLNLLFISLFALLLTSLSPQYPFHYRYILVG